MAFALGMRRATHISWAKHICSQVRSVATKVQRPGPSPEKVTGSPPPSTFAWVDPRRPVSLNQGTLALLLLGGVALGAHHEHLGLSVTGQDPGTLSKGFFADRLPDQLPSFSSLSQSTLSSPPTPLPAHQQPPSGGCLSPYFIADAAAKAAPAVVNIVVVGRGPYPIGSSGSGFLCDAQGTILTNAHVVADAIQSFKSSSTRSAPSSGSKSVSTSSSNSNSREITVTLQDGRIFEGRLVSYDTVSDLAVLKIDAESALPCVTMGTAASLRVGEWVVALGSPLHLQNSVTAGIVSCVDRKAVELGLAGARTDYIQTDAAINKGNSGGPLLNLAGEVIGISCMKALAADGVSFAIPVDTALDVMAQLARYGRVIRPYAGIKMLELNRHNAAQFRKRDPKFPDVKAGILIPHVTPGSPADKAGLRPGDVIVSWASKEGTGTTTKALIAALGEHIGKPLALKVVRAGVGTIIVNVIAQEVPRTDRPPG